MINFIKKILFLTVLVSALLAIAAVYFAMPVTAFWANNFTEYKVDYKESTGNLIQGLTIKYLKVSHKSIPQALTLETLNVRPSWDTILNKQAVIVNFEGNKILFAKPEKLKIVNIPGVFIDDTITRHIEGFDVFNFSFEYDKNNSWKIFNINGISENFLLNGSVSGDIDDNTIFTDLNLSISKEYCDKNIGDLEGILLENKSEKWYGTSIKISGNYRTKLFSLSTDLVQIKINM
ncbi:MAG: hypothetical protein HQL29_03925 [Candidatus Omnitrophica bacterium]|nr:hypothetical protein [Candidatus Omnitrophota bacterium]